MYIDLNVPVPNVTEAPPVASKKNKGKQPQQAQQKQPAVTFTPGQLASIEARIDVLTYLGYTVLALNQTVQKKVDPKTHVNVLDPLLSQLRKRPGIAFLKRLTIVLDEDSEKGFGLTTGSGSIFNPYDIIALLPTTATTFSLACLSHSTPSNVTAHIISLPLTLPRLPFNLKHTQVRTALKNGAVFELPYAGALGAEGDTAGYASEGGNAAKRNWWAGAREVVRVTKGKGIIVTGGVMNQADLRAPRDIGNLLTILGLAQNVAHDASTKVPQSLILRAGTRRTYRAVFSEPTIILPAATTPQPVPEAVVPTPVPPTDTVSSAAASIAENPADAPAMDSVTTPQSDTPPSDPAKIHGKKRARNDSTTEESSAARMKDQLGEGKEKGLGSLKKKKKTGRS